MKTDYNPARIANLRSLAHRGRPDLSGRQVVRLTSAPSVSGLFRDYVFYFHDGTHEKLYEDIDACVTLG